MDKDFSDQYKHPKWQKRRLDYINSLRVRYDGEEDMFCESCGDMDSQLHLHHLIYFKDKKVWDYEDHQLILLCGNCHKQIHEYRDVIKELVAFMGNIPDNYTELLKLLKEIAEMIPPDISKIVTYAKKIRKNG